VKEIRALGRLLVLFRGLEDEMAYVLDAECPHLGANMAKGGKVVGNCLECPWHRWQWNGQDGVCTKIPYQAEIPSIAKTKSYHVRELNGMVLIWYHTEGKDPEYEPELVTELELSTWYYGGAYNRMVRMHLQDFAENTADWQHFQPIHGNLRIPWTSIRVPGVDIQHSADWKKVTGKPHQCHFVDRAHLLFRGRAIPKTQAVADIFFDGPGSITIFKFTIEGLGEAGKPCIVLFHTHLPLKPLLQQVEFRWYHHHKVPKLIVNYVIGNWVNQVHHELLFLLFLF
jgi:cholesterol 7-dehydrogenase